MVINDKEKVSFHALLFKDPVRGNLDGITALNRTILFKSVDCATKFCNIRSFSVHEPN